MGHKRATSWPCHQIPCDASQHPFAQTMGTVGSSYEQAGIELFRNVLNLSRVITGCGRGARDRGDTMASQGLLALAAVAGVLARGISQKMPENELRALVFVSPVPTNAPLILINRSFRWFPTSGTWSAKRVTMDFAFWCSRHPRRASDVASRSGWPRPLRRTASISRQPPDRRPCCGSFPRRGWLC